MPLSPEALRKIPSIDALLREAAAGPISAAHGRDRLAEALRALIEEVRSQGEIRDADLDPKALLARAEARLLRAEASGLRRVINATGVLLHTNLGRAPLSEDAAEAARAAGRRYLSLEFDLETGERGKRGGRLEELLVALTGAPAALAVNNNAAAVLLALNSLSEGREAVVSRGELVEIGGSFRIPEILRKSGASLREVGTTNRTHIRDYRDAVSPRTGAILKVHPSNYRIEGFVAEVGLPELVALGKETGVPVLYDLGGGALFDTRSAGLPGEPEVRAAVADGAAVVCFSGDKLMGGPQAGYAVGARDPIEAMRKNPLRRALRLDKMTLAAAEATLLAHLTGTAEETLPALRMLRLPPEAVETRAAALASAARTRRPDLQISIEPGFSTSGGGSAPDSRIPTRLLLVASPGSSGMALAAALRCAPTPVIARVQDEKLLLDLRTVFPDEDAEVLEALAGLP